MLNSVQTVCVLITEKLAYIRETYISYVECLSKGSFICILGHRFVVLGKSKPITIALGA